MSSEADWRLIRAFIAVMQTGTLTRAAEVLGTTQPTVGRQIRELERLSGDVYFLRRGNRLEPTERAEAMLARARDVEASVTGLARELARPADQDTTIVRLTTSSIFGVFLLPQILPDLLEATPGVVFEIQATEEVHDLKRRDADIAIRFTDPVQGDLIARRIGDISVGLYGSRAYLDRNGRPKGPGDVTRHVVLSDRSGEDVIAACRRLGIDMPPEKLAVRSDSYLVRLAALRAGVGIGPCHNWLAEELPDIERVFPGLDVGSMPLWLVAHEDLRRSRSLRLAFDALQAALKARFGKG